MCWGANSMGQLGDGTDVDRYTPGPVSGLTGVAQLTAGHEFTCALLTNGQAKCWGSNKEGELGDGTVTTKRTTPVTVLGLTGATHIAAGYANACALIGNGQAKCWGNNYNGALGDGTTTNRSSPVTVSGLSGGKSLAAGSAHIVVVLQTGRLKAWGWNSRGQIGDGSLTTRLTPVSVVGIG
ncbi:MAG: hypothetical protein QG597_2815 [Actinomycetota bacterium]|nr:hypothetical protein [Actinomycetota bacterium]